MTKKEFVDRSISLFGEKYKYTYIPENVKKTDSVNIIYKNLTFQQKVSEHLKGVNIESARIRNTNDFINQSKLLWGYNKYDYSKTIYKGNRIPVLIGYGGHIYEQTPINHLSGFKCERNWDTEKFIKNATKIFGDRYDYSNVKYISQNNEVEILYNGISYYQTPYHHLLGRKPEKINESEKLTKEIFIQRCKEIFGDCYDYSRVNYINIRTKVEILYKGKSYFTKPINLLKGSRPENIIVRNTETFIQVAIGKFGNCYDYSEVEYIDTTTPVKIIYEGITFWQKPYCHLRGDKPENRNYKLSTLEFISKSEIIHDYKYNYNKTIYVDSTQKLTITCPIHGDYDQLPNSHLRGHGCKLCIESKGEKEIEKYLKSHNIVFERQKKFFDCKNIFELPFDFYIPYCNLLIEMDGKQHYHPVEYFGGEEAFNKLKINDNIKTTYCEDNYINLLRIAYYDIDRIPEILANHLKH